MNRKVKLAAAGIILIWLITCAVLAYLNGGSLTQPVDETDEYVVALVGCTLIGALYTVAATSMQDRSADDDPSPQNHPALASQDSPGRTHPHVHTTPRLRGTYSSDHSLRSQTTRLLASRANVVGTASSSDDLHSRPSAASRESSSWPSPGCNTTS